MGILQIVFVIGLIASAFYGFIYCLKNKTSLYIKLVVCCVACVAFASLASILHYRLLNIVPRGFKTYDIGAFSALAFLFSANYGTMDSLIDEGDKKFRKYRLIAAIAPIVLTLILIAFWVFTDISFANKLDISIVSLPGLASTYYSLKHLIFPDVGIEFSKLMKKFHIVSIIVVYFTIFFLILDAFYIEWLYNVVTVISGFSTMTLIPICIKSTNKLLKD